MLFISDLKYALRLLAKKPGFSILTMLVMAAGVGLSVFLFSFLNTMSFKALPFKNGDTLVSIRSSQNGDRNSGEINLHDYQQIRTQLKGLAEFSAYHNMPVTVSGRDGARQYLAASVESNIFQLTRTTPILGREITKAENQNGAAKVVVIGYDIWQNKFASDPRIAKQTLRVNGESHRIIGVMPAGYTFPYTAELWLPMREDAAHTVRNKSGKVHGLAHIVNNTALDDVNQQLQVIMQRLEQKYPKTNFGTSAYAVTLQMGILGNAVAGIYAMLVAAVLILLLAAVNVGNLLFSRAIERGKETAIRVALGAPRSRLISQVLWESIIICTVGGTVGFLILAWGLEVTNAVTAGFFVGKPAFWFNYGVDSFTVICFAIFVFSSIIVTGLYPAWKNSAGDFNSVLRDGTRGALGTKSGRLNRLLVISEIFLSMTLLIVASVIVVGTFKANHADNGADTENVMTARILLTGLAYDSPEKQILIVKTLQSKLEHTSNIGNVMISSALPGEFSFNEPTIALEGNEYTKEGNESYPRANYIAIMPGALKNLGVELKQGRYFTPSDNTMGKTTAIVTESFVSRHFPNEAAIGKRLRFVELDADKPNWLTIIGVVEHTIQGPANDPNKKPSVFRPFNQAPQKQISIAMQMKSNQTNVTRYFRNTLESIDPDLPSQQVEPYADNVARYIAPMSFISTIFLVFGFASVVLAASGIYGVMSNTISQRTHEIGVKRALGAWDSLIVKEFLVFGFKQLLWGGIPGLLAGCAMGFAMTQAFVIGNTALIVIAISMISIIGTVVMLAVYVPTKRALQMQPAEALRCE